MEKGKKVGRETFAWTLGYTLFWYVPTLIYFTKCTTPPIQTSNILTLHYNITIGNIFEFDSYPHVTFNKWAQKYGPIYQIHLGIKPWIVVNDASLAHDLMVKGGAICSDRDPDIGTAAFVHPGNRGIIISSGKYFSKVRRLSKLRLLIVPFQIL